MHTFRDKADNVWPIKPLTFGDVARVQRDTGFNLVNFLDPEKVAELLGDLEKLGEVIYVTVMPDDCSPDEFYANFDLGTVNGAVEAISYAVVDYLPEQKKKAMRKLLDVTVKIRNDEMTTMDEKLNRALERLESGLIDLDSAAEELSE